MKIVSGRTGSPHVTSQQFRQMLEGIIGQGSYIVTSGENLKPELSSNNTLKIRSGMMCHHGCVSSVDIGTYDEVTLTNGSQGMKRIDLIVNRHTRNAETEIENCEWKVIMGTPAASNPIVPGYTAGNLQNGDTVDECPVFQVSYDGINVTAVKSLLETVGSLTELNSKTQENLSKNGFIGNSSTTIAIKELPHEQYSYIWTADGIIDKINKYSKGIFIAGGKDGMLIGVIPDGRMVYGYRSGTTWNLFYKNP